jgi:Acetyltransferase (GNAT) family
MTGTIRAGMFFGRAPPDSGGAAVSVEKITYRVLKASDYKAFRAIRLEALGGKDAKYFGASYEEEAAQPSSSWRERCGPTSASSVFGAFTGKHLIGIMAASKAGKHDDAVLWGSVYLQPRYRLQHVAETLYRMRQEWSEAAGIFTRAVFFIREDNERSTAIHLKNGAAIISREEMTFADHSRAIAVWFEKKLPPAEGSARAAGLARHEEPSAAPPRTGAHLPQLRRA